MRTPIAAANWKMFKTVAETAAYFETLRPLLVGVAGVEAVVAPPFTMIAAAAEAARGTGVAIAGQDLHWEAQGAFTGEVSAAMLRDAGAVAVIVGHSERRTKFGETDEGVNRKVHAALAAGLRPIVCIGETLAEREAGATFGVLDRQAEAGLAGLSPAQVAGLVIAYEPVWAIGTGRNATPAQAQDAHAHIRATLERLFGRDAAGRCRILYGGSVKPDNITEIAVQPDVDGALIGGASLDPASFATMVARSRAEKV